MLIGLSGKAGSGKDTAYKFMEDIFLEESRDNIIYNMKFAEGIKKLAAELLEVNHLHFESQEFKAKVIPTSKEGMTYRDFLLELGTGLVRKADPNFWVKKAIRQCNYIDKDHYIFTDTRFTNEADKIREFGGKIIRLECIGNEGIDHISDKQLDDYDFDYVVKAEKGDLGSIKAQIEEIMIDIGLI